MNEPSWDQHFSYIASDDHAHALGRFALAFNLLEMMLSLFFRHYLAESEKLSNHLFGSLNNRQRVDIIKICANETGKRSEIELVEYALKCFDLCSENRNLLLHATPFIQENDGNLIVGKRSDQEKGFIKSYAFDVDTIRCAALDTYCVYQFVLSVTRYLEQPISSGNELSVLPERPPQPRKLSLHRYSIVP